MTTRTTTVAPTYPGPERRVLDPTLPASISTSNRLVYRGAGSGFAAVTDYFVRTGDRLLRVDSHLEARRVEMLHNLMNGHIVTDARTPRTTLPQPTI